MSPIMLMLMVQLMLLLMLMSVKAKVSAVVVLSALLSVSQTMQCMNGFDLRVKIRTRHFTLKVFGDASKTNSGQGLVKV